MAVTKRVFKTSTREAIEGYLYISPWILGFLIFTLIPFVGSFSELFRLRHRHAPALGGALELSPGVL